MKKMIILSLASTAVLVLGACDGKNDPIKSIREASADTNLQLKDFSSPCSVKPLGAILSGLLTGGDASIKSSRTEYRFTGSNVTRKSILYESVNCSGETAGTFTESGSFEIIQGANKTADNATQIDMKFTKLDVKVESDAGAEVARAIRLCGIDSWAKNQEAEVTLKASEATCYGTQVPRDVANVYIVQGNQLFLGAESNDSVSPSSRPTSVDKSVTYTAK